MKTKGMTLIEIIIVLAITMLMASLAGLAVKTMVDSSKTICSVAVIDSLMNLSKATAAKEGNYAGVHFYDQNEALCAMEVIGIYDSNVPYIRLKRLDGSQIKEIGSSGGIDEAVVLFSPSGRLIIKDIMSGTYHSNSSRKLNIDGKDYYINSYIGNLINYP